MQHHRAFAFAAVVVAGTATSQFGCSLILGLQDRTEMGSSAGTATGTGPGTGGAGGGGGTHVGCIPTSNQDPVDDSCGVFVSASLGTLAATGSKADPFQTLAGALLAASKAKARVYVCAEDFSESLTVTTGVDIFGGLDCTKSWEYDAGKQSRLTAPADQIPLTLSQTASSVQLFDFSVQAADAVLEGGSSIAVLADHTTASFTRCDLIAGNGRNGLGGLTSTVSVGPASDTTDPQIRGNDGKAACASSAQSSGGAQKENSACPAVGGGPLGGQGGSAGPSSGANGDAFVATAQTAAGGSGQASGDPTLDCATGKGKKGANGMLGVDGDGAIGMPSIGQLALLGYTGVGGTAGSIGAPGQGGGGGGGAKGKASCAGATGGGGGTGGCGGHGGTGGLPGGASIGLVSLAAMLSFDELHVFLGDGGAGGDGGDGQDGGAGGIGGFGGIGVGTPNACDGGSGGHGGGGGKGGGGRGGHVIGIAVSGGMAPATTGVTFSMKGTPGLGGKGGPSKDGDVGIQADVQPFP